MNEHGLKLKSREERRPLSEYRWKYRQSSAANLHSDSGSGSHGHIHWTWKRRRRADHHVRLHMSKMLLASLNSLSISISGTVTRFVYGRRWRWTRMLAQHYSALAVTLQIRYARPMPVAHVDAAASRWPDIVLGAALWSLHTPSTLLSSLIIVVLLCARFSEVIRHHMSYQ